MPFVQVQKSVRVLRASYGNAMKVYKPVSACRFCLKSFHQDLDHAERFVDCIHGQKLGAEEPFTIHVIRTDNRCIHS